MERRLAAVLIADVVGYGRLSQADEEGTRTRFHASLTQIFEPKIAAHRGRLVKTMGDGILVEFGSVVNALRCAIEIQEAEAEANSGLPPDRRLEFRMAINLGDVIVEGDDIHGTGVNIAARLQALAKPGRVIISGTAYDQVTNKLGVGYEFLGEQRVKNIPEPVRIYGVLTDPNAGRLVDASRQPRQQQGRWRWAAIAAGILIVVVAGGALWFWPPSTAPATVQSPVADARPMLVVLPFDSLSDDKERGYLADGMTEDLTTALARIPGMLVVSRKAAFSYKGKAVPPAQIAQELGVRYILEGSIRRAGEDLRINAQLIDTASSGHLWAERFDGAWSEVFSLQDQVVDKVAAALKLRLVSGPRIASTPGATTVPAAYDLFLRAYGLDYGKEPAKVASLLRQAVALDPDFGQAWAELAWLYWISSGADEAEAALGTPSSGMVSKIKEFLGEAEKHPSSSYYQIMADTLLWQRKWDEAIANAERAIALNPSDQFGYEEMSLVLALNGRAADARDYLDAASRVDPQPRPYRHLLAGLIAFCMEQFDAAIASLEKATPQELGNDHTRRQRLYLLMAAHAYLGHRTDAASARTDLEAITKNATVFRSITTLLFKQADDLQRLWNGLKMAGLPEFPFGLESKDRLTGGEASSLVFGHELRGRAIPSGEPYLRTTTPDGIAHVDLGSIFSDNGISRVDGDFICTLFDKQIDATCAAIFRNESGTPDMQNEYAWATATDHIEFSRVK